MDVYRKHFPEASQKRLVSVGQLSTAVLVILGLVWIPLMKLIEGGIFQKLQSIQAYISPPIAAVFLIGIFNAKITSKGAKISLITGGIIGLLRLTLELAKSSLDGLLLDFVEINFLHFAFYLFVACTAVLFLFSKPEDAKPYESIKDITYRKGSLAVGKSKFNVLISIILIVLLVAIWFIFK